MMNEILSKWSHLKKEFVSEEDAFDLWKYICELIFKIPGEERIIYQTFSVGRQKKGNEDTPIPTRKSCWLWGVPNYLPVFSKRGDENTITKYSQRLQKEAKITKERTNNTLIKTLVDLTFADQRRMIVKDLVKINVFIEKYHLLSIDEGVLILKLYLLLT